MGKMTNTAAQQPPPLRISRTFHAPRTTIFMAWSSADHINRLRNFATKPSSNQGLRRP